MPRLLGYRIAGEKLRALREQRLKRTQRQFGDIVGRSDVAVRRYETQDAPVFPVESMERLAAHMKLSVDQLYEELKPTFMGDAHQAVVLGETPRTENIDPNVAPYTEERIAHPIPLFELSVAAGGWVDVSDNEDGGAERVTTGQMRQGLFRVRLRGDSMEPRFPDGSVVEFRILQTPEGTPDFDAMRDDQCYYVQLCDGTATFKCLQHHNGDGVLVLRAINPTYRKQLKASCVDVVRVAVFEWMLSKGFD